MHDVLVIGGGIVGQVTAIKLAETGARVVIVDAAQNSGSTANAGSLHVQMQSRFMRLYPDQVRNIEASLPFYVAAVQEWGLLDQKYGSFELVRKGGLMLAEDEGQMAFLEKKNGARSAPRRLGRVAGPICSGPDRALAGSANYRCRTLPGRREIEPFGSK